MLLDVLLYFLKLLVILVFVFLITMLLLKYRSKWLLLLVSAILSTGLTILLIFSLNEPSYFQEKQLELLKYWGHSDKRTESKGYAFVKDRFIIIDNSYDKQLIDRPDIGSDSNNSVITDRNKLIRFLNFLNRHIDSIDLVICDISFINPSPVDSLLKEELDGIYLKKKLLIANDPQNIAGDLFKFDPTILGNIREAANDTRFISHTIQRRDHQSLAYKIYAYENKIKSTELWGGNTILSETDSSNKRSLVLNSFVPRFSLTNEALLVGEVPKDNYVPYSDTGMIVPVRNWLTLGFAATADGQEDLLINLKQRRENGQRNYIFIGVFKNPDEDIHNTIYKPMHGVSIIFNTFYDLTNGNNRIGFAHLLTIFMGFLIILLILISSSLKYSVADFTRLVKKDAGIKSGKTPGKKKLSGWSFVLLPLKFLFLKELHYLLLFTLFLLIAHYTGLIFNILYFTFYFLLLEGSMKYFAGKIPTAIKKTHHEK